MKIIELSKEFNKLKFEEDLLIIPITFNKKFHSIVNDLSLVYVYMINSKKEYVITIKHSEAPNSDIKKDDIFKKVIDNNFKKYTINKKQLMYFFDVNKNIYDIQLLYYLNKLKNYNINNYTTKAYTHYYIKYPNYKEINLIIPIYKHYEFCNNIKNSFIKTIINMDINCEEYVIYNNSAIPIFYELEKPGLYLDIKEFDNHFKKINKDFNISNNKIYQDYSFTTLTGRPSNNMNNINFVALNKKDDTRKSFVSRFKENGMLIEFDYSAYHLSLIADLIDYEFPKNEHIHEYLTKKYFRVDEIASDKMLAKGKELSFKLLYSARFEEYKYIPFIKQTSDFIDMIWYEYKSTGRQYIPLINRKNNNIANRGTLFNYIIQNLETKNNLDVLQSLLEYLKNKKSKMVLYNYDAILVDYNFEDGNIIEDIKNIMSCESKFLVHIEYGLNYKELKKLK